MIISGTGITTFTAMVSKDFLPETQLAIEWRQVSDGNWLAVDRGADADTYEAIVNFTGDEDQISAVIDAYEVARAGEAGAGVYALSLTGIGDNEHIFGEDVSHTDASALSVAFMELGERVQRTLKGWGISARLRLVNPVFVGTAAMQTLKYCDVGVAADSSVTVSVRDTYDGSLSYADHDSDAGLFTGTFLLTIAEMRAMRRYIATQRGGIFTLADTFGIAEPFGPRSTGSYPYSCKLIDWSDGGMWGANR